MLVCDISGRNLSGREFKRDIRVRANMTVSRDGQVKAFLDQLVHKNGTYITMAEFFIIRPHGPNCWIGLGAFRDRVRLRNKNKINRSMRLLRLRSLFFFLSVIAVSRSIRA